MRLKHSKNREACTSLASILETCHLNIPEHGKGTWKEVKNKTFERASTFMFVQQA